MWVLILNHVWSNISIKQSILFNPLPSPLSNLNSLLSEASFYRKFVGTLIFTIKTRQVFFVFQYIQWFFEKKWALWEVFRLNSLLSDLFLKGIKITDILTLIRENGTALIVFLLNHPVFEKTELKWIHFRKKGIKRENLFWQENGKYHFNYHASKFQALLPK